MMNDNNDIAPPPPIMKLPTQAKQVYQCIQDAGVEMYIPPPPRTFPPQSKDLVVSPLSGLSTDIWLCILVHFSKKELIHLKFVSKKWRRLIRNPNLWLEMNFTDFCRQGNYYHRYLRWIELIKKPQFVKLKSLKLYPHMYVGPRYFKELAHYCPKVEKLEVSRPEPLKLIDLWDIGRYLGNLRSLSIPEIPTSISDAEDCVETDQPRCTLNMKKVLQEFKHNKIRNLLLGQYRPFLDNSMLRVLARDFPDLKNLCLVNGTGDSDYLRQLNQDVSAGLVFLLKELQLESLCLARVIINDDGWRQLLPLLEGLERVDMHHVSGIPTFVIKALVGERFRQTSIYLMNCQGRELELNLVPDLAHDAPNFVALQYPTVPFSSQPRNMDQFLSGSLPPRRIDEPDYETDEEINNHPDTDEDSEY